MQESPDNKLSFLEMELRHQENQGPRAQGIDYAAMDPRYCDERERPARLAQNEAAREEGSKH